MMEGVSISFPERAEPDPAQIAVVSEEDLVQHLVRLELETRIDKLPLMVIQQTWNVLLRLLKSHHVQSF